MEVQDVRSVAGFHRHVQGPRVAGLSPRTNHFLGSITGTYRGSLRWRNIRHMIGWRPKMRGNCFDNLGALVEIGRALSDVSDSCLIGCLMDPLTHY
jgi:hypothetical protein